MIIDGSLAYQKNVWQSVNPSHLISVVDPGYLPKTPNNIQNHLKLGFDDIIEIKEPIVHAEILVPHKYIGPIIKLCNEKRGKEVKFNYQGNRH